MTTESTPAKVRFSDQLGYADEAHPLVRRLDEMASGWLCAGLPDAELPAAAAREIERLRAGMLAASRQLGEWADAMGATVDERDRLRAALEVSQAATNAAVSKAQWQARTNSELNEQAATIRRLKADICRLLNADNDEA